MGDSIVDKGLRLTTKNIRSKGSSHKNTDLKKQLKTAFKLSVTNAKRRQNKQKKSEKVLKLAMGILERCKTVLKPLNVDDLKIAIADLDASYRSVLTDPILSGIEIECEGDGNSIDNNDNEEERIREGTREKEPTRSTSAYTSDINARKTLSNFKTRTVRTAVRKTLSKSQASFKKKLDRLTETIRTVEATKKIIESLRKQIVKNEEKNVNFKKQMCIDFKANFCPLFGGAIGDEGRARTDPYGDNLSKSVWDSKTSKPS
jgi:hypothetical protein